MATTFKIEWGAYHQTPLAQFSPADELDELHSPLDYDFGLNGDVIDWCERTECEIPEVAVLKWATHERQEFPSLIALRFEDDALAILFRMKWLHKLET